METNILFLFFLFFLLMMIKNFATHLCKENVKNIINFTIYILQTTNVLVIK